MKAEILKQGSDITIISYGSQLRHARMAVAMAEKEGISCEIIDLRTIMPWDEKTVIESVQKTGRCLVTHEAPISCGFGAELVAKI